MQMLTDYQIIMVGPIFSNKGTVDKFIGDAVEVIFGFPISQGNDFQNAFDCAILMNKNLASWNKDRSWKGLQDI